MNHQTIIGQNLHRIRLAANISEETLAQRMGISLTRLREHERGSHPISPMRLTRFAQQLHCTIEQLCQIDPSLPSPRPLIETLIDTIEASAKHHLQE